MEPDHIWVHKEVYLVVCRVGVVGKCMKKPNAPGITVTGEPWKKKFPPIPALQYNYYMNLYGPSNYRAGTPTTTGVTSGVGAGAGTGPRPTGPGGDGGPSGPPRRPGYPEYVPETIPEVPIPEPVTPRPCPGR